MRLAGEPVSQLNQEQKPANPLTDSPPNQRWLKLKDIKAGDEIAVVKGAINHKPLALNSEAGEEIAVAKSEALGYFLIRKSFSSRIKSLLLKSVKEANFESNLFIAFISFVTEGGWILNRIIPKCLWGGYINILEKCTSLVTNILLSLSANFITSPFLVPAGALLDHGLLILNILPLLNEYSRQ